MTRKLLALTLVGVVAVAGLVASSPSRRALAGAGHTAALDVLFIGNSLLGTTATTGEDTPDVIRRLARSTGRTVRATKVIRFGSTLQKTWDAGLVRGALRGRYDYVVLQEYSTLVTQRPALARRTLVRTYAPALAAVLKPGGRVILFKNWALTDTRPFPNRARNVAAIDTAYARMSAALPLPNVIAPIGDAFETVIARDGTSALIVPDGKHPTGQAVYLDAATLYGLMFRTSPRALPDLFVSPQAAAELRAAAAAALGY